MKLIPSNSCSYRRKIWRQSLIKHSTQVFFQGILQNFSEQHFYRRPVSKCSQKSYSKMDIGDLNFSSTLLNSSILKPFLDLHKSLFHFFSLNLSYFTLNSSSCDEIYDRRKNFPRSS